MAVFPENIRFIYPVVLEPEWLTLVTDLDNGGEQRREKWLFCKFNVRGKLTRLAMEYGAQAIFDFYQARHGAAQSFYFFEPGLTYGIVTSYQDLYVGIGDGATAIFDLPGKYTSAQKIYINGVEQSAGYIILAGTGDGGADQVSFEGEDVRVARDGKTRIDRDGNVRVTRSGIGAGALAVGALVSCDFTGSLRVRCRFREDRLPRELFIRKLYQYGVDLKGLGPA
jgi:hypothetical protein